MTTDTPNMLNLTLPLKQDAHSLAVLGEFAAKFETDLLPRVWQVLEESQMVHYARFTLIDNKYLQVLTEYDTDFEAYSNFFADRLREFFGKLFSLVEGAPDGSLAGDRATMLAFIKKHDLPNLGNHGFSAYGPRTVVEIQQKFGINP